MIENTPYIPAFLGASVVTQLLKKPPANAGEARNVDLIPGSGRSPGEEMVKVAWVSARQRTVPLFTVPFPGPTVSATREVLVDVWSVMHWQFLKNCVKKLIFSFPVSSEEHCL